MDVVMSEAVEQFFGAYFHQDWHEDDPNWQSAIHRFLSDTSADNLLLVTQGIEEIIGENWSEETLQNLLLQNFGCYYDPTGDGSSYAQWLREVHNFLRSEGANHNSRHPKGVQLHSPGQRPGNKDEK